MSPDLLAYWLLGLLTVAVCLFAIWKGGRGERHGGAVVLAMVLAERLSRAALGQAAGPGTDLNLIVSLSGDALTALMLLVVTVRFGSPWLGAVMLFYGLQFAVHAFYLIVPTANDLFRVIAIDVTFAGIHICLVVGTIMAWRRRQGAGREPFPSGAA